MSKIDLIIDALNSFTQRTVDVKSGTRRMCCGDPIEEKHTQHCIGLKALAAARELKALKPVAMVDHSHPYSDDSVYMIANYERSLPSGTKLYALDGEQA